MLLKCMKKYVDRARVVAIGEIEYNLINDLEEELFINKWILVTKICS